MKNRAILFPAKPTKSTTMDFYWHVKVLSTSWYLCEVSSSSLTCKPPLPHIQSQPPPLIQSRALWEQSQVISHHNQWQIRKQYNTLFYWLCFNGTSTSWEGFVCFISPLPQRRYAWKINLFYWLSRQVLKQMQHLW